MGLDRLHTSIFIETPSLVRLTAKAKEDPSPHEIRSSPMNIIPVFPSLSGETRKLLLLLGNKYYYCYSHYYYYYFHYYYYYYYCYYYYYYIICIDTIY